MRVIGWIAAAPLFVASLAAAVAPQRAFVSTGGNDANVAANCAFTAPCRSFDAAISVVAGKGEVVALDSGGYGRFTVTKSVTVSAPSGVYAGISVFSGTNGVDINAAGVEVTLRGLVINGQGGDHGIFFQSGAALVVENCVIGSMGGTGIRVVAAGSSNNSPSKTLIVGTTVTRNDVGIHVSGGPASVTVRASNIAGNHNMGIEGRGTLAGVDNMIEIADSAVANNDNGVLIFADVSGATIEAIVTGSTLSTNASNGIYGMAVSGGSILVTATGNTIARNFNGVAADGPGVVRVVLGQNTISRQRQTGVFISAGTTVLSRGDNTINDNVSSDVFNGPMGAIGGL